MAHYVDVDSKEFFAFLESLGYTRGLSGDEIVYYKECGNNIFVKCYTSVRQGDTEARDVGKDAIRVVAIFDDGKKNFAIFKGNRVYRTTSQQSVHERTLERLKDAEAKCTTWAAREKSHADMTTKQLIEHVIPEKPGVHKASTPTVGEFFGTVGETVRLTLKVIGRKQYHTKILFTMRDREGRTFVYWSQRDVLQVDELYDIKAKIVAHNTFMNVKQTVLDECAGKRIVR